MVNARAQEGSGSWDFKRSQWGISHKGKELGGLVGNFSRTL